MDKSLILHLIKKDLEEMMTLVAHFESNPHHISSALELASNKLNNLNKEFEMLEQQISLEEDSSPRLQEQEQQLQDEPTLTKVQNIISEPHISKEQPETKKEEDIIIQTEIEEQKENTYNCDFINMNLINSTKDSSEKIQETTIKVQPEILGQKRNNKDIKDIRSIIGINDRILFIRELFSNSPQNYNQTIDQINHTPSLNAALQWLNKRYTWDTEDPYVQQFMDIIQRKYN